MMILLENFIGVDSFSLWEYRILWGKTYDKLRIRSSGLFSREIKSHRAPSLSSNTHLFFSFIAKAGI